MLNIKLLNRILVQKMLEIAKTGAHKTSTKDINKVIDEEVTAFQNEYKEGIKKEETESGNPIKIIKENE